MALSLNRTDFQSPIRSLPLRENQIAIENFVNDLQSQIDNLATPPAGSEVTNARDYADVLRDRLRYASSAYPNVVISGGVVTEQSTPDMTVAISAGQAIVNGTVCVWDAQNSGTITAPSSNPRFDVVVINSDNSISIVAGTESADAVLPSISDSQKAVAILMLTSSTTSITSSEIIDARKQGAYYSKEGAYKSKFLIQDAINDAGSGDIYIEQGEYYEEVDISGISDISLTYAKGANHYRTSDTAYCIKSVNTLGSESENISIRGASLHRNGKATQGMCLLFDYVTDSTLDGNRYYDNGNENDYAESTITNCNAIVEDGRMNDEMVSFDDGTDTDVFLKYGYSDNTEYSSTCFLATDLSANLSYSIDGVTWITRAFPITSAMMCGIRNNGEYFAAIIGDSSADLYGIRSTNGVSWESELIATGGATNLLPSPYSCWNGDLFCTIATVLFASEGRVYISSDGLNWTYTAHSFANGASGLCAHNGLLCALTSGSASAYTSPDGITWTARTLPASATWSGVASNGSILCAIASGGTIAATSTNGITWTARTLPASATWSSIAYGNGVFCAIASGGTVAATSPDGITWTARTLPANATWTEIDFNGEIFVAIASGSASAATSPDGITWTARTLPVSTTWTSIGSRQKIILSKRLKHR